MILMDEMIPMRLYKNKQRAYIPFNPANKKKGSIVTLLTRSLNDSIDLINTPFFHNPSYYISYYQDRNVKRYLSNDGNITIEGEEEDPDVEDLNEAVIHKNPKNKPEVTSYGNTNDLRLLQVNFDKKIFDEWFDYFKVRKQHRIYPHVYGFNSQNDMFKAIGQEVIEKHGELITYSYNSATEIVVLNNSEYSTTLKSVDGPYDMYCKAAIITYIIHIGFPKATWKLANNMATHLSGQDQYLYQKNNFKSDDRIGMAMLIGKYDDKYGRNGMIDLARSGDYYKLIQFGAKGFIDRIAKAAKQEAAITESSSLIPIDELANIPDNKIVVGTDYHFIGYNKEKTKIILKPKSYTDAVIKTQNKLVGDDGIFIFLGDLFYKSFRNEYDIPADMKDDGIALAKKLKGKYKILVRGNHDNLPDEFYIEKCGFTHVCQAVLYNNILFTHQPEIVPIGMVNVHGHIHGTRQYIESEPARHMDVWTMGSAHTGILPDILDKQEAYDKTTKQAPNIMKADPYQYIPGQRLVLDDIISESALHESDGTHLDVVRIFKNMSDKDQKFVSNDRSFQDWGIGKTNNCLYRHIEREGLLGLIGFVECYKDLYDGASVVIGVDPKHRGEGIATKMMEQMLKELSKEHPEITNLIWRADAKNKKSQGLAEKFGFKLIRSSSVQNVYRKWLKNENEDYVLIPKEVVNETSLVKWMRRKFEIGGETNFDSKIRPLKDIMRSKKITRFESGIVIYTALKKMCLNTTPVIFVEHGGNISLIGDCYFAIIHTYRDWNEHVLMIDPFNKSLKSGIADIGNAENLFKYVGAQLHNDSTWGDSSMFNATFSYVPYLEELKAGNNIYRDIVKIQSMGESTLLEFTTKNRIAPSEFVNDKLPMSLDRLKKLEINEDVIKKYSPYMKGLHHVRTTNNCKGYLWVDPRNKIRVAQLPTPVCYYNVQHKKDENSDSGEVIWLQGIEVNDDYQGRTLAKQLLDKAIRDEGVTNLAVDKDNEVAIRLYRSRGFKPYNANGSMINMQIPIKRESVFISPNDDAVMTLENQMFVFTEELSQSAYNSKLRQYLYKDRIRSSSQQIAIYNRVKESCPKIRKAYVNPKMYSGLNTFIDLSYYNDLFLRNNTYARDIAIKFYWEYLHRMFQGTDPYFRSYSKNTIFIPVWKGAWDVKPDTYVYDWKQNINPISLIFRMIRRNPTELSSQWGKYNFIFVGRTGYFRVNFSIFQLKNLVKFKINLNKLWNNEPIEDDEEENGYSGGSMAADTPDDTSSSAAITAQVVDQVEKSTGIEINDISAAVTNTDQDTSAITTPKDDPIVDASAVDKIPDMKIRNSAIPMPNTSLGIGIVAAGENDMLNTIKDISKLMKSRTPITNFFSR